MKNQILVSFLVDMGMGEAILEFLENHRNSQGNCKKKNKPGGITLLDFKLSYKAKAIVIKTARSWHKTINIK
jgi:hypothetical protein